MISAVVLAAGRAERMGEQKLLLPLRDKPVLQWVLESALESEVHEVICVVRDLEAVRRRISLAGDRLFWFVNYAADRGQSTSVVAGLWAIDPKSAGALFLVGDQPSAALHGLSLPAFRDKRETRCCFGAICSRSLSGSRAIGADES